MERRQRREVQCQAKGQMRDKVEGLGWVMCGFSRDGAAGSETPSTTYVGKRLNVQSI